MWLLLLGFLVPVHGAECRHSSERFSCVEYVDNYDGDTITFTIPRVNALFGEHIRIRLQGIDAPEVASKKECERDLAEKVKKKVHDKLVQAKRIDLVKPKRDKYFRILADVEIDGESLSEYLLKNKWAISYHGEKKPVYDWCEPKAKSKEENGEAPAITDILNYDLSLPHEPFQGRYVFSSELQPQLKAHNVRIYLNNDEARERMREYMNKGYICENVMGGNVICRKLVDLAEIPDNVLRKMNKQVTRLVVEFSPHEGGGQLITDGETYREWQIPAEVTVGNEKYDSYILSKTTSGVVKVTMGYDSNDKTRYSFVVMGDELKFYVRAVVEKKWEWSEYSALAVFHSIQTK